MKFICLLALLFSYSAHAEFSIILTNCEFTSDSPEKAALDYVQVRRIYLSTVGSDDPQDQIAYSGMMFRHANPDIQLSGIQVDRTPAVPAVPKKNGSVRGWSRFQFDLRCENTQRHVCLQKFHRHPTRAMLSVG